MGSGPCHLSVDRLGKNVLVANYGSGSVACLPIDRRRPAGARKLVYSASRLGCQSESGSKAPMRIRSISMPQADLPSQPISGSTRFSIYRFDAASGKLTPNEPAFVKVAPGSGPRHFAFHPGGRFGYVINEMANTVIALAYDADKGSLTEIQTISTLPADFKGTSYTAEVQVHPSGKFLYGSNRGHNSIAIFAIEPETGKLSTVGFEPTQGKNPRNFAIDPTGHSCWQRTRIPTRSSCSGSIPKPVPCDRQAKPLVWPSRCVSR